MEEKTIRAYAALMEELGLTRLEFSDERGSLCLERGGNAGVPVSAPVAVQPPAPAGEESCEVSSPIVGVFYRAPAENAAPFVEVGSRVAKGDVLCIIEAMKLMNEISAECDGIITEVCVKNGDVVDFGCPLFRLKEVSP